MEGFVLRIGTFFIVIGIGIFVLFAASNYAGNPNFDYLCIGAASIATGILIRRRKPPPPPSGRFRLWKNLFGKKPKEEKK